MNLKHKNNISIAGWFGGLLFPVAGFVYALLHPKSGSYKLLTMLFFTFVGLAYFYSHGGTDAQEYINYFDSACSQSDISFFQYYKSIAEAQQIDYYNAFITWLVSRFTSNGKIFLGILAFILAYFLTENVIFVINRCKINSLTIFFLAVLILMQPFGFLTHRWWTAMQVFLYGLLSVVFDNKKLKFLWCVAAAWIFHFSFVYPLAIVAVALLLPKKNVLPYLVLYLASFLVNQFDFTRFIPFLNVIFSDAITGRTEGYILFELQEHNFFSQSARFVMNVVNVVLTIYIFTKGRNILDNNKEFRIFFVISLVIGAFAQLTGLTEWGWRFFDLSNMMFVTVYVFYMSQENVNIEVFRYVTPLLVYFMVFQIRTFFTIIGPEQLLFGNFITTWFIKDTNSVLEIIKSIL